jgi:L-lactate dehydrogenase (cytochrome)
MQGNRSSFAQYDLLPEVLTDVSNVNMTTTVMGQTIPFPLILAPTGLSRLFHHQGEKAVATAAARAGLIYSLSSGSSVSIEEIGALTDGPKWFQIYVWKDRALVSEFISRARAANYQALCLTVDVQVYGNRQRDLYNGMTTPIRLSRKLAFDLASHPRWWFNLITKGQPQLANVKDKMGDNITDLNSQAAYINRQFDRSVTWDDASWMIREWGGPFAIKGILSPADALRAVEIGANGIVVSNHGGRQLDQAAAPVDVLPAIVDAVEGRADIVVDGGIRRGTDIIKALALGAKACMTGRPYLYGLAAGGEAGVSRALDIFSDEVERDMSLLGVTRTADIGPRHLRHKNDAPRYPSNY